ncbi:MAG: hypothetical protein ACI9HK_002418 [Pirellulaceae bacterium]
MGINDAEFLSRQLSKFVGEIKPEDLANLPKYTAYCRLLIDGMPSQPFSMATIDPGAATEDRSMIVREQSRRQFSRAIDAVKADIQQEFQVI